MTLRRVNRFLIASVFLTAVTCCVGLEQDKKYINVDADLAIENGGEILDELVEMEDACESDAGIEIDDADADAEADIDAEPSSFPAACPGGILEGDHLITSAEDIAEIAGCVNATGTIEVTGDELIDLKGLESLEVIRRRLFIHETRYLQSLDGLNNLELVGDLDIGYYYDIHNPYEYSIGGEYNYSLNDISALGNLRIVGGNVIIAGNMSLVDLVGLGNVHSIWGSLTILINNSLTGLDGLDGLTTVGGRLFLFGNDELLSISALSNLEYIGTGLILLFNPLLVSLEGLERITIAPEINVSGCSSLRDLTGLNGVTEIAGILTIGERIYDMGGDWVYYGNDSLVSLAGLENVGYVRHNLNIHGNPNLSSLSVLAGLPTIGRNLAITMNSSLPTCDAKNLRDRFTETGWQGEVEIYGNDNSAPCSCSGRVWDGDFDILTRDDLDILVEHTAVTGSLTIAGTPLHDLGGLHCLNAVEGDLRIGENSNLRSISGLRSIASVGGDLVVDNNDGLPSLFGMDNLLTVGGSLVVAGNDHLQSTVYLRRLTSVLGSIEIHSNGRLITLAGLDQIAALGGNLKVVDNPRLPACEAELLRDALHDAGWTGAADVRNNDASGACDCSWDPLIGDYLVEAPADLEPLRGHRAILGSLSIESTRMDDLIGLECLTEIEEGLFFEDGSVHSLTGLGNLVHIGGDLEVEDLYQLEDLAGLDNLTAVEGSFTTRLDLRSTPGNTGLDRLSYIGADLRIHGRPDLAKLFGSGGPEVVGGELNIGSGYIENLLGLERLTEIRGSFTLRGCGSLVDLHGLDKLSRIGSFMVITANRSLKNLSGLDGLTYIGGDMDIGYSLRYQSFGERNDALVDLTGLEQLNEIGGRIYLRENPMLQTIAALGILETLGSDLFIIDNPKLPTCECEDLKMRLTELGWDGEAIIMGNDDLGTCK